MISIITLNFNTKNYVPLVFRIKHEVQEEKGT